MQLMPATAAEYGVSDPFAAAQSIRAGAMHLRMLMRRFDGDLTLVAAAYNAGIGALERYGGVPPYAETQGYVAKVLALHQRYREALAPRAARGSDEVIPGQVPFRSRHGLDRLRPRPSRDQKALSPFSPRDKDADPVLISSRGSRGA